MPKPYARVTTVLALTIASTAIARNLTTITDKATGYDSPSAVDNIDITGSIATLSLDIIERKVGDWVRRQHNGTDFDVQLEKDNGDDAYAEPARCYEDGDHAALLGAQPVNVNSYPYRTGPLVLDDGGAIDYLGAVASDDPISVQSTFDVATVRFLTGGAHIAPVSYTVRFNYTDATSQTVAVPIALDTNATRGGSGAGFTRGAFNSLTATPNAAFDENAAGGSDCAGDEGDEIVVTNPNLVKIVQSVEFEYVAYGDATANVGWLDGPIAVSIESDQVSLESTYDYVGLWSSSVSVGDAPVDMPAHADTAIWYEFAYTTAGLTSGSRITLEFQCGDDDNANSSLAQSELSTAEVVQLVDGANTFELASPCFGRYIQYDVEIIDGGANPTTDPRLLDITFRYDPDHDADGFGQDNEIGNGVDCVDSDPNAHPGAPEITGNNVDNDCNGSEDCFHDVDDDGFRLGTVDAGGSNNDTDCNDNDEGVVGDPTGDCNDNNGAIRPGVAEITGDNVDQNCDLVEDCFTDADNDGARTGANNVGGDNNDADCNDALEAVTADPNDCNDGDAAINPSASEIKGDEIDQNCDGDEDCWPDVDMDGDRASTGLTASTTDTDCTDNGEGRTSDPVDCNDGNAAINSGAAEIAGDGIDQDCDTDELCFTDVDNDGARLATTVVSSDTDCLDANEGQTADAIDCNDANSAINPAATELKGDEIDQNCDTDELCWPDADNDNERDSAGQVNSGDLDCDDVGEGATSDIIDCNDGNVAINSTAAELTGDNVDQNCDNVENCFTDGDNDGARLSSTNTGGDNDDADCNDAREGVTADPIDCNDGDATVSPLAAEIKGNNVDNNCNTAEDCWPDVDNDGDRASAGVVVSADSDCTDANEGATTDPVDCDDARADRASTNAETAGNNVDNNCDNVENCFTDADNDGNRLTTVVIGGSNNDADCQDANEGEATDSQPDCNDNDATVRQGIAEVVGNNVDNNCDNSEDCFTDADNDNSRLTSVVVGGTNGDSDCQDPNEGQLSDPASDCNDGVAAIHFAAAEIAGDNVDQNCDTDELCFTDSDNDGARLTTTFTSSDTDCTDANEGEGTDAIDCVDNNPAINPAAAELKGDEIDQNCDTQETCWPDVDNDNTRANAGQQASSDVDCDDNNEGATSDLVDCDDNDNTRSPLLTEIVGNEEDENCDLQETCFADADNDNAHATTTVVSADFDCDDNGEDPLTTLVDCDDANPDRSPYLTETGAYLANGVDNDCNGGEVCYLDDDNDDYRSATTLVSTDADCNDSREALVGAGPDCVDTNSAINPGEVDVCGNGVDDNCTGVASDHGGLAFDDDDGDTLDYAFETNYSFGGVACLLSDCDDDTDGDGVTDDDEVSAAVRSNACDDDTDGDGLRDDVEIGPNPNNPIDTDSDGTDDVLDTDDDNDGIPTSVERVARANPDGDGLQNYHDLDSDGDGYTDEYEWDEALNQTTHDTDADGDADYVDTDSDGDSLTDATELGTQGAPTDTDTDNIDNRLDNDDDDDCVPTTQEVGFNSDADGVTDYLDDDDDDDGLVSCDENPDNAGTPFADNTDGDGLPNFRDPDDDQDGIPTLVEIGVPASRPNCVNDGDTRPTHLDTDSDGDGFLDQHESPVGVLVNTDGDPDIDMCDLDSDQDRVTDALEEDHPIDTDGDGQQNRVDPDDDGDGLRTDLECGYPTACDTDPLNDDTDSDGTDNYLDSDDDDDGVGTLIELPLANTDSDGRPDWADVDDDNDTVLTEDELPAIQDIDADSLPNYRDDDDDGDSLLTADENDGGSPLAWDFDADSLPNFLDMDDDQDEKYTLCEVLWLGDSGYHLNADSDVDGLTDGQEWGAWDRTGPLIAESDCSEPWNADGTDQYDVLDNDDDNDGLLTFLEIFSNEVYARSADDDCLWEDLDSDGEIDVNEFNPAIPAGDGIPDHRDTDSDNDGIRDGDVDPDTEQIETFGEDTDLDGVDNIDDCDQSGCDGDSDGDGLTNADETRVCCRLREAGTDELFDGSLSESDINQMCTSLDAGSSGDGCGCVLTTTRDHDLDGVIDPDEVVGLTAVQPDLDGDGIADVIDADDDGDGLPSLVENLYQRPTDCDLDQWAPGQVRQTNLCAFAFGPEFILDEAVFDWGYRCTETDGTSFLFQFCSDYSNVDAADASEPGNPRPRTSDNAPNYLDADDDGDGDPTLGEQGANPDIDCDGIVNWFDRADESGSCADADGDGLSNEDEVAIGSNPFSNDSDDDGVTDDVEYGDGGQPRDTDDDGVVDILDTDDDGDGIPTLLEGQADDDADEDDVPDYLDTDSDDDGIPDGVEGLADADCDGLADALDSEDGGACDSASAPLKYARSACACDASSSGSSFALVIGVVALIARRRRVRG